MGYRITVYWVFFVFFVTSVSSYGNVKDGVSGLTKLVLKYELTSLLQGQKISLVPQTEFSDRKNCDVLVFSRLLQDAEFLHQKIAPILSSLYFRLFMVNLDSQCRLRQRVDSCDSGNDFAHKIMGLSIGSNPNPANDPPQCKVGRCNVNEVPADLRNSRLEHFVLRYANDSRELDLHPLDIYGRDLLYADILGLHGKGSAGSVAVGSGSGSAGSASPTFVDLSRNPPSYTGYRGGKDWSRIYEAAVTADCQVPCRESQHLYRLVSGMQSSISAMAGWNYRCINPVEAYEMKTEVPRYRHNFSFYYSHLGGHPNRIENLMYAFQTLVGALCRLRPFFSTFAENLGSIKGQSDVQCALLELINTNFHSCEGLQDSLASGKDARSTQHLALHPQVLEKFEELSQIIDCVDCEKCRLHGKAKLTALQIAVRVFAQEESEQILERNEIVALMHTLDYFAQSLIIVQVFKHMHRRQLILYPLQAMVAVILVLILIYRKELFYALFYCTILDTE